MEYLILLAFWSVPIALGYIFGRSAEARHYRAIHEREKAIVHLPATSLKRPMGSGAVARSELVTGVEVLAYGTAIYYA